MTDTRQALAALPPGWALETGTGGFGEKGDRWVCVRNLASQCGQDFYADRDPLIFNFLAALAAQPVAGAVARDREADRARFPDPAFNQWLDEGISDAGHTVWDQVGSVVDAWHGWENRKFYPDPQPQAAPAPEPSAQAVREPGDPLHDDAYVRGVAVGFAEDDSRRTTLLRIADRMQKLAAAQVTGDRTLTPGCHTPEGCRENGCLGWCDEHRPEAGPDSKTPNV